MTDKDFLCLTAFPDFSHGSGGDNDRNFHIKKL